MTIEIKSTLRSVPIRAVVFGADGVGKSTLCAGCPGAVFIAAEDGLDNIDAQQVAPPETWPQIIEAVDALADEPRCSAIVIDSLDWAEQALFAHIVATKPDEKGRKVKDIEGYGYGKGYVAALNEWRGLVASLQRAGKLGKHVLLIAHAQRKAVKNPTGEDYEQWQIKLNEKAAGLIREWVHIVAYAELDIAVDDSGSRTKGIWSGKRVLRCNPSAGYTGKTRLTMPDRIPLDWPAFAEAVKAGRPPSVEELAAELGRVLMSADIPGIGERSEKFLDARGRTAAAYTDALANVRRIIETTKEAEEAK
jgi:hypothetical protein